MGLPLKPVTATLTFANFQVQVKLAMNQAKLLRMTLTLGQDLHKMSLITCVGSFSFANYFFNVHSSSIGRTSGLSLRNFVTWRYIRTCVVVSRMELLAARKDKGTFKVLNCFKP